VQRQEDGGVWVGGPRKRVFSKLCIRNKCCNVRRYRLDFWSAQTLDRHLAGRNQKLKAIAALKGQSLKDYVLGRALGDAPALDRMSEDEAFTALTNFLEPRIEQARRGQLSGKSLDEIRREERRRRC